MSLDNVSRDDWMVGGLALLLAIDLLFLPWFSITVGAGAFSVSASTTATGAPDGWLGILAMLCCLAVVADLAIERLSPQTTLPMIRGSRAQTPRRFSWRSSSCFTSISACSGLVSGPRSC